MPFLMSISENTRRNERYDRLNKKKKKRPFLKTGCKR